MQTTHITPTQLAQHPTVLALSEIQRAQGLSDAGFVRAARLGYSESVWSRIKSGKYPAPAKVLANLTTALAKASNTPETGEGRFILFEHVKTAIASLDIAKATSGPIRLVFFVGPTGCGKTHFAQHLRDHHDGIIVEAAPSWRKSYLAALCDIAGQINIPGEFRSVRAAERAVLLALAASPRTLVIDEGNYFNQDGLNFLKLILNRTRCSIVLCTLPTDFNRMLRDAAHEANQLVRPAVSIVRVPTVSTGDVTAMQAAAWPHLELNGYAGKIAEGANRFGRYDFVRRVLDEAEPGDATDIPCAIARVNEHINTSPLAA